MKIWQFVLGILFTVMGFLSIAHANPTFEIDLSQLRPAWAIEREILSSIEGSLDGGMDLGLRGLPGASEDAFHWISTDVQEFAIRQVLCVAQDEQSKLSLGWSEWPSDANSLAMQACGSQCLSLGCMIR